MTTPRHDERDMDAALRSWLRADDGPTNDRDLRVGRIMDAVDETGQRRRLWPPNPFGRGAVHSATGTDGSIIATHGRTAAIVPVRVLAVFAITLLMTSALVWVASQPPEGRAVPAGWVIEPQDRALFERWVTLWAGDDTDLATTLEVYADDAVHHVLWLDDVEVVRGDVGLWRRMRQSASVETTDLRLVRLMDHYAGARRYLLVPDSGGTTGRANAACVLWVEEEEVTRHDCILPTSIDDDELQPMSAPDDSAIAEREALSMAHIEALDQRDRTALELVLSPEINHHSMSTNQVYTLRGIDQYWSVMSQGGIMTLTDADLPAPEGEVRWADFSSIGNGTLCVFWAEGGRISRHDCVVPGRTTVSPALTEITDPPASRAAT